MLGIEALAFAATNNGFNPRVSYSLISSKSFYLKLYNCDAISQFERTVKMPSNIVEMLLIIYISVRTVIESSLIVFSKIINLYSRNNLPLFSRNNCYSLKMILLQNSRSAERYVQQSQTFLAKLHLNAIASSLVLQFYIVHSTILL